MSKSDSEVQGSARKLSRKIKSSSSSGSRRIKLGHSDKAQIHEQLPLTHTIPRITVDALSDAQHLLHLNDNPTVLSKIRNQQSVAPDLGYMESKMKAYGMRRALAPITNIRNRHGILAGVSERNHPLHEQCTKPFVQRHSGQMEIAQSHVLHYSNPCDMLDINPLLSNVRMTGSLGGHRDTSFNLHKPSGGIITSSQV